MGLNSLATGPAPAAIAIEYNGWRFPQGALTEEFEGRLQGGLVFGLGELLANALPVESEVGGLHAWNWIELDRERCFHHRRILKFG